MAKEAIPGRWLRRLVEVQVRRGASREQKPARIGMWEQSAQAPEAQKASTGETESQAVTSAGSRSLRAGPGSQDSTDVSPNIPAQRWHRKMTCSGRRQDPRPRNPSIPYHRGNMPPGSPNTAAPDKNAARKAQTWSGRNSESASPSPRLAFPEVAEAAIGLLPG